MQVNFVNFIHFSSNRAQWTLDNMLWKMNMTCIMSREYKGQSKTNKEQNIGKVCQKRLAWDKICPYINYIQFETFVQIDLYY
jgi:hypothetical protein